MEPPANHKIAAGKTEEVYLKEYADFINLATHDLDAPLRKLSTLVSMLTNKIRPGLEDSEDKDALRYIERIESCVTDMRSMIDDLALLSHITVEKKDCALCDLQSIAEAVKEELQQSIKEKKAVISISSLPEINGVASLYHRVLWHIIQNALKFSKPGVSPEIKVRSSQLSANEQRDHDLPGDNVYYKIEIEDNGIGFSQDNAERIFRPFERLHGKSQFGGHGIGLAICQKIITLHKGIIYAKGAENSGARFVLLLPQTADNAC